MARILAQGAGSAGMPDGARYTWPDARTVVEVDPRHVPLLMAAHPGWYRILADHEPAPGAVAEHDASRDRDAAEHVGDQPEAPEANQPEAPEPAAVRADTKWTVDQLRTLAASRGLATSGNKAQLLERLERITELGPGWRALVNERLG